MESQDPHVPNDQSVPAGGVTMVEPVFESGGFTGDTIVVPPSGPSSGQKAPAEIPQAPSTVSNPFIPSVAPADTGSIPPQRKNPLVILFVLLGAVLVLAAIGAVVMKLVGGSKAAVPAQNVTINYWGLWENDTVTRQFIADFEATHPTIKVQYTMQSPKQYRERLQSAITRGEGPDVFRFHNTWVPMLRQQLATVPPNVMTPADFSSTFFPIINNDLIAGQSIFGIPLMFDGLGLYINEELFSTAGASEPATWTDVINLIPKLTVKNGSAIVTSAIALGTASNVEHFSDILAVMFLQNGANLTNLTGKEAEGTLIFYRKFADPSDPLYTWSDGMDNSVSAFANGRVAMILAPSWRSHEIIQLNKKLRFHVIPIPQLQGNTVTWASYWVEGVSSRSKYQDAAWEFVKYMTSSEAASKLYTTAGSSRLFGEPYARMDLANTITNDPYVGAYVKQAQYARSFPVASRTHDNGINDRLIQYLTDAVNGMANGVSPTQVLITVSSGFRQVLSSYGISTAVEPTAAP